MIAVYFRIWLHAVSFRCRRDAAKNCPHLPKGKQYSIVRCAIFCCDGVGFRRFYFVRFAAFRLCYHGDYVAFVYLCTIFSAKQLNFTV